MLKHSMALLIMMLFLSGPLLVFWFQENLQIVSNQGRIEIDLSGINAEILMNCQ
jgi:hypothetical protein